MDAQGHQSDFDRRTRTPLPTIPESHGDVRLSGMNASLLSSQTSGFSITRQALAPAMSNETWDDPQVSLMACADDPETAASRPLQAPSDPRASAASSARASGDAVAGSDDFARRGSRPGPARVPSNQQAVRELEKLWRELRGLSSSWPTLSPHGVSDVAASQGAVEGNWYEDFQCSPTDLNAARSMFRPAPGDSQPLVSLGGCKEHPWSIQSRCHKCDPRDVELFIYTNFTDAPPHAHLDAQGRQPEFDELQSNEPWNDTQASRMTGAAVARGTLRRSTQAPPRSPSDPETAASRRPPLATSDRRASASCSARARGDAGRDIFPRRGSESGPARVPSDQQAVNELEELRRELHRLASSHGFLSPKSPHPLLDEELSLSRRRGKAILDMVHESWTRRPAHPRAARADGERRSPTPSGRKLSSLQKGNERVPVSRARSRSLSSSVRVVVKGALQSRALGLETGVVPRHSECSLDAFEAMQRRQNAQVCCESEQSDQRTLRRRQYLVVQHLHATRREPKVRAHWSTPKFDSGWKASERAKDRFRLAGEAVRRREKTAASPDTDTDTDTDSPSTSTERPRQRLHRHVHWLCFLLGLALFGCATLGFLLLLSIRLYVQ